MVSLTRRDWLLPSVLSAVSLVVVVVVLSGWWLFGWPDDVASVVMDGMVALGTLTLAVVAWLQNKTTIRQMRIDRAKDGIVKLIARWIDPIYAQLTDEQARLAEQDTTEPTDFPPITPVSEPFRETPFEEQDLPDRIIDEIGEEYARLPSDLVTYNRTVVKYREIRQQLRASLEEYFSTTFQYYLESPSVNDDITAYLKENSVEFESPESYLQENVQAFADTVLIGHPDTSAYTAGFWEHVPQTPMDVRTNAEFQETFNELDSIYADLRERNDLLVDRLDSARIRFKDQYDIVESEIVEVKF